MRTFKSLSASGPRLDHPATPAAAVCRLSPIPRRRSDRDIPVDGIPLKTSWRTANSLLSGVVEISATVSGNSSTKWRQITL
ncbi:hypothetical protein SKAU_G00137830 [Synaphobranchus kaupii]|uniref:Uncharacterized protein n=1 Tax=Synaphobranchus kaupii TaxID=118154 RepID=A0A9Q1J1V2_SYNKA|nr:hypothetical protein SKAU_G00137830 [Synaphobranchus kaupii]